MKRFISFSVAFLLAFISILGKVDISFADSNMPSITAEYAILMDYETGKVLYDKNGSKKLYPASTTKVWTAYIVLKHITDLNQVVQIQNIPHVEGSSMYLRNGESFTVKELLDSLLIHSSNDVAIVLANYVSGSIQKFTELMNSEAKAIGAKNTHFNNPHGLHDENHYTTAYDMALMAREAMSNEVFREIVKKTNVKYKATDAYPQERYFVNTNKFLSSTEKINYKGKNIDIKYDIIDGIKTGFTNDAGRCLLSSGIKNNMRLISAVFKSKENDVYLDSRTILDYGFDNFVSTTIVNKSDLIGSLDVKFTKQKKLVYEPLHSYKVILPKGSKKNEYETNIKLNKINLPIKKGDVVGKLDVYNGKSLEASIDLVATDNLDSVFDFITKSKIIPNVIKIILVILIIFILAFVSLIIIKKIRKKRRRKNKPLNKINNRNIINNKKIYNLDDIRRKKRK